MASGLERLTQSLERPATKRPGRESVDRFWDKYGLTGNPYPPSRTIIREILYDQIPAYDRFIRVVQDILVDTPSRRALAIIAGTGGGKTHFLNYCQWSFGEAVCRKRGRKFLIVDVVAGASTTIDMVRSVVAAANSYCQRAGFASLGAALIARASDGSKVDLFNDAEVDDVRGALHHLAGATQQGSASDRLGTYTPEFLYELFNRWLEGANLTETQRKYLGVVSRLNTGPVAIRALTDILDIARKLDLIEGVFLSVDELESLFGGVIRSSQYQAFLQDLRFLFDQSTQGSSGYSLLVLSSATATGADRLRDTMYPLYQRLGYEGDGRVTLSQIQGVVAAKEFSSAFLAHAHEKWKELNPGRTPDRPPLSFLSDQQIEDAYREAASPSGSELSRSTPQGPLLEVLWRTAASARERDQG